MRTTIDLPEDLLRRVRATAALKGVKLKDFVAGLLEAGLGSAPGPVPRRGHPGAIPVTIEAGRLSVRNLTNAEVFEILDREDDERIG